MATILCITMASFLDLLTLYYPLRKPPLDAPQSIGDVGALVVMILTDKVVS